MQVSENWLRRWVDPPLDSAGLAEQLTMAGLEVGAVDPAAPPFSSVVVGRIDACDKHPNADKLSVCIVHVGTNEPLNIVCGAPNARTGLWVAVAVPGARLPGGLQIRTTKLRGEVSEGMICSNRELGLGDDHDGIIELPEGGELGQDLREFLDLDDQVLDVDLTPNRGDCLGVAGIAREVGALNSLDVAGPDIADVKAVIADELPIKLSAPDACPCYAGRVVRGVDLSATTPLWLRERLRRGGLRPIHPVVDVTNYVMLELGQPMHAFDLAKLSGGIEVRFAHADEKLALLDGQEVELDEDMLVIADHVQAVALGGIMGGAGSAVTSASHDIFFESAFFSPTAISGRARRIGLHTDASHRFERGVDPIGQARAIERATALLIQIAGGEPGPVTVALADKNPGKRAPIGLERERLNRLIGIDIPDREVAGILTRLGIAVSNTDDGWNATPPSFRFDLTIAEDLIEEVARVYGYDNVPEINASVPMRVGPDTETRVPLRRIKHALVSRGYQEAITYSFVDLKTQEKLAPGATPIHLQNPISADMGVMRANLWPGLLTTIKNNLSRQQERVRIFEHGLKFLDEGEGIKQIESLALAVTGPLNPERWRGNRRAADFHDLRADLESLLSLTGASEQFSFEPGTHPALHPGQTAALMRGSEQVGIAGALHPRVTGELGLDQTVFLADIEIMPAFAAIVPAYAPISRYPAIRRDIAVEVDEQISAAEIESVAKAAAPRTLTALRVFDVYRGKSIDSGRKSIALGLILQDSSRTLTDEDGDAAVRAVVSSLTQQLQARIRD